MRRQQPRHGFIKRVRVILVVFVRRLAADSVGLHLIIAPARLLEVFGSALRTDEWRFRRVGVRAIHFSTGYHDDYHEPTDTPDKLIPGQMSRIARAAAALLAHLTSGPS